MYKKPKIFVQVILVILIFVVGYLILNHRPIVVGVLYRWAAGDHKNSILNLFLFMMQGGLLWLAFILLPKLFFGLLVLLVFLSGAVNIVYQQVLGTLLDAASVQWMLQEVRQLETAYNEFSLPFVIGLFKSFFAVFLMALSRFAFIRLGVTDQIFVSVRFSKYKLLVVFLIIFIMVDVLMTNAGRSRAGEMNIYGVLFRQFTEAVPDRLSPAVDLASKPVVGKIVLLVDESIGWNSYDQILKPSWVSNYSGIDFGEARALSNCSAQSNAAIRWGVNVKNLNAATDLRRNSTIWAYAKKAGYRTTLIDGQTLGSPQNFLWRAEWSLIDDIYSAEKGVDTDFKIAVDINKILQREGRDYVYVVLRGAHYPYHGNYPNGELDRNLPKSLQYERAVSYSKKSFMETVFSGVNRSNVVVFYTSDHGQYIDGDRVPHCNEKPMAEELSVPLVMFPPEFMSHAYHPRSNLGLIHSHSQIFPTSLVFMGYRADYASEAYDSPLPHRSKRLVRFGKKMYPRADGDRIEYFLN